MLDLEYYSKFILICCNVENDRFIIINLNDYELGLQTTKMVVIDTFVDGLTNFDVEMAIKEVLNDDDHYDIDYELEEYRKSRLYEILRCNDDE